MFEARAGGPLRVLIIDDAPEVCAVLEVGGRRWNLKVTTTPNGRDGLALALEQVFDVLILDLRLPDTPGLSVLRQMRARNVLTPVIVMTGYPDYASALESGRCGAATYLTKPVSIRGIAMAAHAAAASAKVAIPQANSKPAGTVWLRAAEMLRRLADGEFSAVDGSEILDLLVDASIDLEETTLPQVALLGRVVRDLITDSGQMRDSARRELALVAEKPQLEATKLNPALQQLLGPFRSPHRLKEESLALEFGIDPATISRQIRRLVGSGFRELRWASLVRPAIAPLARTSEPIGRTALECGYEPARLAQFDRDIRQVLGVSPSVFREFALSVKRARKN